MTSPFLPLLRRLAAGSLRVWLFTGLVLRLTGLRDFWKPASLVYYTTPFPVMAFCFLGLALHERWRGKEHAMQRNLILMAGTLFAWYHWSWIDTAPPAPAAGTGATIRCVHWNVARPTWRLPRVAAWIRAQDPDLVSVAEAVHADFPSVARWQKEFPGYSLVPLPSEMICLVRGDVITAETGDLAPGSGYGLLQVRVRGHLVRLLQADIYGPPVEPLGYSRGTPLRRMVEIAEEHRQEPLLVWGDFNTPRESRYFDALRAHFTPAFEAAGHGFIETWPMPAPALSLDQLWTSPGLHAERCRAGYQMWSDHRPVVAEFTVR